MTGKHGTPHHGEAPFGVLAGLKIGEQAGRLVEITLSEVRDEDILADLSHYPSEIRRKILRIVGLGAMKSPTSRAAATVLQRMRRGKVAGSDTLRLIFASRVHHAFHNHDGLSAADCVILLSGDPDGVLLDRAPSIVGVLTGYDDQAQRLLRWSLAGAIANGAELAAVALGLLHASRDELGPEGASIVQSGWAELREREVLLPATPVSAAHLRARVLALQTNGGVAAPDASTSADTSDDRVDDVEEDAAQDAEEDAAQDAEDETTTDAAQSGAITPGRLGDLLRSARTSFTTAAEATGRALLAFQSERRPDDEDLAQITDAVLQFDALSAAIPQLTTEPGDRTLGQLETAVKNLSQEATRTDRIQALVGIRGPDSIEELLKQVRAAAATGAPAELHLLTDLIELAADGDDARIDELSETARNKLPQAWSQVITAAVRGRLSLVPVATLARPTAQAVPTKPLQSPESAAVSDSPGVSDHPGAEPAPKPASDELDDLDLLLLQDAARRERDAWQAEVPGTSSIEPSSAVPPEPQYTQPSAEPDLPADASPELSGSALEQPQQPQQPQLDTNGSPADKASQADNAGPEDNGGQARPQSTDSWSIAGARTDRVRAAVAEAAALRSGRLGLAAWIRTAMERPAAEAQARRTAAIAHEMGTFAGHMSTAFIQTAHDVDREALDGDPAGQLLAWAAAIRAGIIQPTPESSRLLQELAPVVSRYPGLAAFGDAFSQAAADGVYLVAAVSNQLKDTVQAEERLTAASAAAARVRDEGPNRKIKLQRATEVWKEVLREASPVGTLLYLAAGNVTSRVDEATAVLNQLRANGAIDRLINDTGKKVRSGPSSSKIIAGARKRLTELISEALETVATWVTAVHEVDACRTGDGEEHWMEQRLAELRHRTTAVKEQALDELADLAGAADPVLGAAAEVARRLTEKALELIDGAVLDEEPAAIGPLLGRDLLLAPGIMVDPDTLWPSTPPALDQLITVALNDADWTTAFEDRAARGDHQGTQAIVTVLLRTDPRVSAALRKRRDDLVTEAEAARAARIEALRDRLAQLRRSGALAEGDATRLEGRLRSMRAAQRDDYGRLAAELGSYEAELNDLVALHRAEARTLLADHLDRPQVAAAAQRITECIDRDDLTTAREFLAQAVAGRALPRPSRQVGHFARFYPGFPEVFDTIQRTAGRSPSGDQHGAIRELADALISGREVADERLRRLLDGAGIDLARLRRRAVGREALRQWQTVALGPKPAGNLTSSISTVLRMIGISAAQRPGQHERSRTWVELETVRLTGPALLPDFGSRMSPSGDHLRLLLVWNQPSPKEIIALLKDEPNDQTILVWYFGTLSPEDRKDLTTATRRNPRPVTAVLDDAAIGYLACLPEPEWAATVSLLAPFTSTNPFSPTGDVPEEMFYGRSDHLDQVTDRSGSCIVYGGRQLGKSALLKASERRIRASDPNRITLLESIYNVGRGKPAKAVWPTLRLSLEKAGVISPALPGSGGGEQICHAVRQWIAEDKKRQLLILLDEADEFLNKDAAEQFTNVAALRDLMTDTGRQVKVVFAGTHQTTRFRNLPNQPLAHLGEPVAIGPLAPQDAFDLLTRPLTTLGFNFPDTLAARVIADANNAPALIQLFADALLSRLQKTQSGDRTLPYEINRDDVEAIWADEKLSRGFRDRFEWTIDLDKRYKVIAFVVAANALAEGTEVALPASALLTECRGWWPQGFEGLPSDGFRGLLEECVELGVLAMEEERFRLRTPHILTLLGGAEEVENALLHAEDFDLPDSFDAQSYRAPYHDGPDRSPLSDGQVERLLRPRNLVYVVAGSEALQLERVAEALRTEARRSHQIAFVERVQQGRVTFDGAVEKAGQRGGHNVVLVDLGDRSLAQAVERIGQANQAVSRHRNGSLAVVFIVRPDLAPVWLAAKGFGADDENPLCDLAGSAELVELQRFNKASIRQWMRQEAHAFQDEHGQEALLGATGGWPILISALLAGGDMGDREQALDRCRDLVRRRREHLVQAAGVLACPPVTYAWRALVDLKAPGEPADLADLLVLDATADDHPLSAEVLRASGYRSAADIIEVLRILGALVPAQGAERYLICEPVLAQATSDARGTTSDTRGTTSDTRGTT